MATKTKAETKEEGKKEEALTPSEYFQKMKELTNEDSVDAIEAVKTVALQKMKKYLVTGQAAAAKTLYDIAELAIREQKIVAAGYTKYVRLDDLTHYIDNVADDAVCITELKDFDREIPDDIVEIIAKCKEANLFDRYYVCFTDYTGKVRKNIEEQRRSKDPILFGNLRIQGDVSEKMYYLGDWVDEYCDLTLDKLVKVMSKKYGNDGKNIVHELDKAINIDTAKDLLEGKLEVDPFDFTIKKKQTKKKKKDADEGINE